MRFPGICLLLIWLCCSRLYADTVFIIGTADLHGDLAAFARLAPVIRDYPDAVKVDCGDLIQGGYKASVSQGKTMFAALNSLQYDFFVPGNHEFEFDFPVFSRWQQIFHGRILGAQWDYGDFSPVRFGIVQKGRYRIGIIGAGESNMISRQMFIPGLRFADTAEALRRVIKEVKDAKCDAVILACHIALQGSFGTIYRILQEFPEINAVISSHSHREHPGEIIAGRIVVQPGAYGKSAALLKLHFSAGKHLEMITSALLPSGMAADPEIMEIYERAGKISEQKNRRWNQEFPDFESFGKFAARILRISCSADAAVCRLGSRAFRKNVNAEILFKMLPFNNRIFIVESHCEKIQEFIKRRTTQYYRCFADIAPGKSGSVKVAIPDYLLWSDPEWQKLPRRYISVFARETLEKHLEKSL